MLRHPRSWSIRTKLVSMLLVVGIGSVLVVGYLGLESGRSSLSDSIFNHLTSVRAVKASQIESYFRSVRQEIRTLAQGPAIVTAMKAFRTSFPELSHRSVTPAWDAQLGAYYEQEFLPRLSPNLDAAPDAAKYRPSEAAARYLQYHYIAANPHPVGEKELLNQADDGSAYSDVHGRYHPLLRNVIERFGYYDLFFIDAESGRIVYSVFKETDFATSLWTGPYRESNLAGVAKAVLASGVNGQYAISDFERYDPSYAAPAAFVASPIVEGTQVIGVLAAQLPIDEINQIMTGGEKWEQDGLGKSGETYLVGSDYFMRSVSRFLIQDRETYLGTLRRIGVDKRMIDRIDRLDTSILQQAVRTSGVDEALASQTGTRVIDDYRGIPVLSSYAPLDIEGLDWVILSEIDFAEANAPIVAFQTRVLFWTGVIVTIIVILSIVFPTCSYAPYSR